MLAGLGASRRDRRTDQARFPRGPTRTCACFTTTVRGADLRVMGDIWIYELGSGRSSRVTTDGTSHMGVWDPDGLRIADRLAKGGNLEAWGRAV